MRTQEVINYLDDYLNYKRFKPDSMVNIVPIIDLEARMHFLPQYLNNNSGIMQLNNDSVERVICTVFPSEDVFSYLQENDVSDSLLFIKHSLEWEELGRGFIPMSKNQLKLLKNKRISLYSAHSAVDNNPEFAPSMTFAKQIGYEIVEELKIDGRNYGWIIMPHIILTFNDFKSRLLTITNLTNLQQHYDHDIVHKIAVSAGGGDFLQLLCQSINKGCDTYVTGILYFRGSEFARKYNPEFVDKMIEEKLNGFGISHYLTEVEGIRILSSILGVNLGISSTFVDEIDKTAELKENWGIVL